MVEEQECDAHKRHLSRGGRLRGAVAPRAFLAREKQPCVFGWIVWSSDQTHQAVGDLIVVCCLEFTTVGEFPVLGEAYCILYVDQVI